jgi:hypothetical protein
MPRTNAPADHDHDRRQQQLTRHAAHVRDLLERRSDLSGAIALADLVRDASTWAA